MQFQFKGVKKEQYEKYLELIPDLKKEKAQKYITIVLTLATVITLGLFAINPTLSTIANLQKQIDDNNFVQQKLQQKINDLALLQGKYSDLQTDLPMIYNSVPKTTEVSLLIAGVQSIAKDSSLKITSLQTSEVNLSKPTPKGSSFDFTLTANGSYSNILQFLDEISHFQRAVALKDITISTQNDSLVLSFNGTAFFKQ